MAARQSDLLGIIRRRINPAEYQELHWEGAFQDYLSLVQDNTLVLRNAYQRLYDMILSYGSEPRPEIGDKVMYFRFFDDPIDDGKDAVYGLERRVLLLHGPVGSSKSTIARMLKKGMEQYSRTKTGMIFTFSWQFDEA